MNRRSGTVVMVRTQKKSTTVSRSDPNILDREGEKKLQDITFQRWLESKRQEQVQRLQEQKECRKMNAEQELIKKETAKLSYALWKHKKDQEKKAKELRELQVKEDQEQQKRLKQQQSKERVSQWMRSSKLKPRPVPSNLGLQSLHGTQPKGYFNPHPWVDPV